MIIVGLGVVLAVLGYALGFYIMTTIGVILVVFGLVALAAGGFGYPVGGRKWWW